MPLSCNVLECFTARFISVGALTAISQYTEIVELEAVIATQYIYTGESSLRSANTIGTSKWENPQEKPKSQVQVPHW